MVKRPLVIACIGYIIGILWGLYLKISIISFCMFFNFFLVCIYIINKKIRRYGKLLLNKALVIFEIFAIIGNFVIMYNENKYNDFLADNEQINIVAVILSDAQNSNYYIKYKIKITDGKYKGRVLWLNLKKNKIEKYFQYGNEITINGKYRQPEVQRNKYGFDYQKYLKSKGIQGSIICDIANVKVINEKYANSLTCGLHHIKTDIKDKLKRWLEAENAGLIIGMILGDKNEIDEEIQNNFKSSNLAHLLAVSGTHISYIILTLSFAVKKMKINKKIGYILIIFALFCFTVMVGNTPSVIRATIMAGLILLSKIIYEKSDIFTNLAISAFIILIQNPYSVWDIGFQLSYLATIGIIIFYSEFLSFLNRKNTKSKFINEIVALSISAQLLILPVLAYNFHKFSINFILSNIIATPLFALSVIYTIIMLVLGSICDILGKVLGYGLNKVLWCFNKSASIIGNISFTNIIIIRPDFINICIYYLVLIIGYKIIKIVKRKETWESLTNIERKELCYVKKIEKHKKIIIKLIALLLLSIVLFKGIIANYIPQDLKINFIDVGQGDACLIQTRYHKNILIDGGGSLKEDEYNVGEKILMPYILNKKINYIDYMIISHFDADHVRSDYYI